MKDGKHIGIFTIAGLAIIAWLVLAKPFGEVPPDERGEFQQVLSAMGDKQAETSDELTTAAVAPVEGVYVGEHEVHGANWSIPNILRHVLGVN